MRTIKFRGRDGNWHYGSLIQYKSGDVAIANFERYGYECSTMSRINVDPETVGQFTGLVDKNGREIYEGDFINYDGSTWGGVVQWHPNGYFFINDSYGKKYPRCDRYRALGDMLDGRPLVVVGNIHDNPELIKKGGNDESDVH